jgi:hypothetical protein
MDLSREGRWRLLSLRMREFVAEVARAQAKVRERREMRGGKSSKSGPGPKGRGISGTQ